MNVLPKRKKRKEKMSMVFQFYFVFKQSITLMVNKLNTLVGAIEKRLKIYFQEYFSSEFIILAGNEVVTEEDSDVFKKLKEIIIEMTDKRPLNRK